MLGRSSPEDLGGGIDHIDHGSNPAKNAPKTDKTTLLLQEAGTKACLKMATGGVSAPGDHLFRTHRSRQMASPVAPHAGGISDLNLTCRCEEPCAAYLPRPPMRVLDALQIFNGQESGQFHSIRKF
jgi:hypothetical protein